MLQDYPIFNQTLRDICHPKALINTINAHSYNTVQKDADFHQALQCSDVLLPDGVGVVWAMRMLTGEKIRKIAGADLFHYEMERLNSTSGKCFFLGSTDKTLQKIREKCSTEYPQIQVHTFSPPYKTEFTPEDNDLIIRKVNEVNPDVLFVGMTAPKQEKWAYKNFEKLQAGHVCCIGAVFDFYAGNVKRAPGWIIRLGMEWSFRLIKEPRRLWRRYLIGNMKFVGYILMEKLKSGYHNPQQKESSSRT
ncbi:MAG TPA: WecB/TagA/CpsF family glycosyltransferase [Paludibacter sp.]|nr:WecB/TagA/CpsF family glycosyltransferase [Paludibacter sp.]